jgi:hypothetical protein
MKYISEGRHGFDHRPYWEYLELVRGTMPAHLFEFASNPENHDLKSPNSLHDSWLEYWRIAEISEDGRRRFRSLKIDACFLGPMHDRYIFLHYKNVEQHAITAPHDSPYRGAQHGDLLVHELVMVREGLFSHELVFSLGAVFSLQFEELEHRVELIAKST